jgi:hypothetical protein
MAARPISASNGGAEAPDQSASFRTTNWFHDKNLCSIREVTIVIKSVGFFHRFMEIGCNRV